MSTAENSDIFPLTVLPCPEAKGPRIGPAIRQPNAEVNFGQTRKQNPAKQGNDLWPNEEVPCRITAKAATVGDAVGNHPFWTVGTSRSQKRCFYLSESIENG